VLDPELPVIDGAKIEPGRSAIYRDVQAMTAANHGDRSCYTARIG